MSHADEGTLHAYLDGELPAAERARLEAHLAECATCRDRLTEERGLIERADRLLALAELPTGHTHRPAPVHARRPRPRFVVPSAWAASIALAFLAGWLLRPAPEFRAAFVPNDTNAVATAAAPTQDAAPPPMVRSSATAPAPKAPRPADAPVDRSAVTLTRQAVTPEIAGKVAGPTLRGAAPAPIPPATVATVPAAPDFRRLEAASEAVPRRPIGTTWTVIAPEPARKVLGTDVARIPGLPVRDIRQNPTSPGEVMVEQEVADGTVIQLFQSRLDSVPLAFGNLQAASVADAVSPLKKTVGRLQVRISGPLAADSLLRLLELVR